MRKFVVMTYCEVHPDCPPIELIATDSTEVWPVIAKQYGVEKDPPDESEKEWEMNDDGEEESEVPGNAEIIDVAQLQIDFHSKLGVVHDILDWDDPETILKVWKFLNDFRDNFYTRN